MIQALLMAALTAVAPREGENAAVTRTDASGSSDFNPVKIEWSPSIPGPVSLSLEWGACGKKEFSLTNSCRAWLVNLELGRKYRWTVRSAQDSVSSFFTTAYTPPRLLLVGGVGDFRDLGGWPVSGNRRVRQNMLFRSSAWRQSASGASGPAVSARRVPGDDIITPDAIGYLRDTLGIKTDIELRDAGEAALMTSSVLGKDVSWVKIPFAAYGGIDDIVEGRERFANLMAVLSSPASYPAAFHCTDGRDRTGTLSFLLLALLGVDEKNLVREWSVSFGADELPRKKAEIERLIGYLKSFGEANIALNAEAYALSSGVSASAIAAFREIMLEGGAR